VDDDSARYEGAVLYIDMAGKRDVVGNYHAVADPAIVRHMRRSHYEAV
jgi:hypothetical protein